MSASDALKYVPRWIVTWAFIVLVCVFVVFSSIAIYAWSQDDSITLFDMDFGKTGGSAALPSGAVLAFASPDGCPVEAGWQEYGPAVGRFIIGVNSDNRNGRSSREFGAPGGEETVALKIEEMPKHRHKNGSRYAFLYASGNEIIDLGSLPVRKVASGSGKKTDLGNETSRKSNTEFTGEGKPHNNMPPYVALYFCTKT